MRRISVAALALLLTVGVALLSIPDQIVAVGRPDLVLAMPLLPEAAAEPLLRQKGGQRLNEGDRRLATSVLKASLVSPIALSRLADDARLSGNFRRASKLFSLAGSLSWHDTVVQAAIVDFAMARDDPSVAVLHSDALLRQGDLEPEIFDLFDNHGGEPKFRLALASRIALQPPWAGYYLATHGADVPAAALQSYISSYGRALDRVIAGPLLVGLLQQRRFDIVHEIVSRTRGLAGATAGPLPWPGADALDNPTPFDWSLGPGVVVSGDGSSIQPSGEAQQGASSRLLALPAGRYRLASGNGAQEWEWGIACLPDGAVPSRSITADAYFSVAVDCPIQQLAVKPAPTNINIALPRLSVGPG